MERISSRIEVDSKREKMSNMIVAMEEIERQMDEPSRIPEGLFGHTVVIQTTGVEIKNDVLDVEFSIPFDDDLEANEAEIIIYNLTDNTISQFKNGEIINVTAGYKDDTGIIFSGRISKVITKKVGSDKQTAVHAIDCQKFEERSIESIAYVKGTTASYILNDLIKKAQLPVEQFAIKRDHTYTDAITINDSIMANIKKYAEVCGVSAYINQGKVYVRHIKDGDNINLDVSVETGLIGSPEAFEEDVTAADFKDVVQGYNIQTLLHHRVTTGVIINLKSAYVNGSFRVRSGSHSYNGTDFITEMSVI